MLKDIPTKAPLTELVKVKDELKRFALYEDFTSLYSKTVPIVKTNSEKVQDMAVELL
jgi:hypothetical protein